MSTYLFTSKSTFNVINSSSVTKEYADHYMNLNRNLNPKMGFNLISEHGMSINEFFKFADEKIIGKKFDLDFYNSGGNVNLSEMKAEMILDGNYNNINININNNNNNYLANFSHYNQYISYKYKVLVLFTKKTPLYNLFKWSN